jgi:hypothetical protein
MKRNKTPPPPSRRSFASGWTELVYLCAKIHYWLYSRYQTRAAERYLDRLERVLGELPKNHVAIIRQEGLALLYQLKGQIGKSIRHRKREIELIERLQRGLQSPEYSESMRAYVLRGRDASALEERRMILKALQGEIPLRSASANRHTKREGFGS